MASAYSLYIELITNIKVDAMTGDRYYAYSSDPHVLVIVCKGYSTYKAVLSNLTARNTPYEKLKEKSRKFISRLEAMMDGT